MTPHIVRPGESGEIGTTKLGIPAPGPLPTLPPGTQMPSPRKRAPGEETPRNERPAPAEAPAPVEVPMPMQVPTPGSYTPPPGGVAPSPTPGSRSALPQASANASSPAPLPTAFSQTNVYTFGQAPQNNYASANAAPQIFYVQVSPSVVKNGQAMTISAITTTNVAKLMFGPNKIVPLASLQSIGPGQWQAQFNFSPAGMPIGQGNVTLLLTATTGIGSTVSLPIPLSLVSP